MKIWNNFGSEHSANLVMIGHFKDVGAAEEAKTSIEELQTFFCDSENEPDGERYSKEVSELLSRLNFQSIGPTELEQFRYDISVKQQGDQVVITTDEIEVSGLLKFLFNRGARIEVYSAHGHSGTGHGRDTKSTD
jgi:hypothetical protein